jgi:hypothetical protein
MSKHRKGVIDGVRLTLVECMAHRAQAWSKIGYVLLEWQKYPI